MYTLCAYYLIIQHSITISSLVKFNLSTLCYFIRKRKLVPFKGQTSNCSLQLHCAFDLLFSIFVIVCFSSSSPARGKKIVQVGDRVPYLPPPPPTPRRRREKPRAKSTALEGRASCRARHTREHEHACQRAPMVWEWGEDGCRCGRTSGCGHGHARWRPHGGGGGGLARVRPAWGASPRRRRRSAYGGGAVASNQAKAIPPRCLLTQSSTGRRRRWRRAPVQRVDDERAEIIIGPPNGFGPYNTPGSHLRQIDSRRLVLDSTARMTLNPARFLPQPALPALKMVAFVD
jgi:hypothetical protein